MRPYIFLFLSCSLVWTSCFQDCTPQDVKVGDMKLMSTTRAFVQQFVGKKVIFKSENGHEMIFRDTSSNGISRDSNQVLVRQNCNAGIFGNQKSWDFVITEGLRVMLEADSFNLNYRAWMTRNLYIKSDTNNVFEVMGFAVSDNSFSCSASSIAIFSDRGFPARRSDTSDTYSRFREVRDTTVGTKRFQNINFKRETNQICNAGIARTNRTPIELFFNFKQGIVAFKTTGGVFWFFDRIE